MTSAIPRKSCSAAEKYEIDVVLTDKDTLVIGDRKLLSRKIFRGQQLFGQRELHHIQTVEQLIVPHSAAHDECREDCSGNLFEKTVSPIRKKVKEEMGLRSGGSIRSAHWSGHSKSCSEQCNGVLLVNGGRMGSS